MHAAGEAQSNPPAGCRNMSALVGGVSWALVGGVPPRVLMVGVSWALACGITPRMPMVGGVSLQTAVGLVGEVSRRCR